MSTRGGGRRWSFSPPYFSFDYKNVETSLTVQWLRLCNSNAGSMDEIPGWETKIPHVVQGGQKINTIGRLVGFCCCFVFCLGSLFFKNLFIFNCLYNVVLVSATHQHESAKGIRVPSLKTFLKMEPLSSQRDTPLPAPLHLSQAFYAANLFPSLSPCSETEDPMLY